MTTLFFILAACEIVLMLAVVSILRVPKKYADLCINTPNP